LSDEVDDAVTLRIASKADKILRRWAKKDRSILTQIRRKIEDIRANPEMGIPKKYHLSGYRGVHVGPFVILYVWDEHERIVEIMDIPHHDHAYS
jgi:mRNA-degrading endonuclease RelE of RelBE toxin-antitoxin system